MNNEKILKEKEWIIETMRHKSMQNFGKTIEEINDAQKYQILALTVRDQIMEKRALSSGRRMEAGARKVYYLSVEFLIGRLMSNNMINLLSDTAYRAACDELGINLNAVEEYEPEPGLGNGGLGRLAACFLDSLTSMSLPAMGCSIRYEFGLFRQKILDGNQVELADNWLENGNIWEIPVPEDECEVHFYGRVEEDWSSGKLKVKHVDYSTVLAMPYDIPVVGYDTNRVNQLRLWSAKAPERINMHYFNQGEYTRMMEEKDLAEVISKVLYPEDRHIQGKELRLRQHYFLASATMQLIVKDFKKTYTDDLTRLPEKIAIQINDTHPGLAIPELMRIMMDENGYSWEDAEYVCRRVFAYTNHTVLSEALERWGEDIVKTTLPRIYSILVEMNRRLCKRLWDFYPNQWEKIASMAIIAYGQIHMANLCVDIAHTVNGVSQLHAQILKRDTFRDFYVTDPGKFLGITNGITHRRWLLDSNPGLTNLICEAIGDGFKRDPSKLEDLLAFRKDKAFLDKYAQVKRDNKVRLSNYLKERQGEDIDPDSIFDVQAKRLHEYKRQLLNILHVMHLYNRIKTEPRFRMPKKTFIFAAKAAPGYSMAKQIIKLINDVARMINNDPKASKYLKVVFLENYCVSNAEILIPAANISEQISTAGKEASGTGNMKFMMNGALTCGTMDGANVEIYERVGNENIYIFGLLAQEVDNLIKHNQYRAGQVYEADARIRRVLDQLIDGTINPDQPKMFGDIYHALLFGQWGQMADPYLVLKDFDAYVSVKERINKDYTNHYKWQEMALVNTAMSGFFSSDRTIDEYNQRIWGLSPITE